MVFQDLNVFSDTESQQIVLYSLCSAFPDKARKSGKEKKEKQSGEREGTGGRLDIWGLISFTPKAGLVLILLNYFTNP